MRNDTKYWKCLYRLFFIKESPPQKDYTEERLLQKATEEMTNAYNLLSRVEDPEMVEYAVLTIKAAEIRYGYLLKQVKASRACSLG